MKPASAKGKGRRLQNEVAALFRKCYLEKEPGGHPDDIKTAVMGESGKDLMFFGHARPMFEYAIECKNQEKLNIWKTMKQAESNASDNEVPIAIFKRNYSKTYVTMSLSDFFVLVHEYVI